MTKNEPFAESMSFRRVRIPPKEITTRPLSLRLATIINICPGQEKFYPLAGQQFLISPDVTATLSELSYPHLAQALRTEWTMEKITRTFNCLLAEWQGRDYLLILSWQELGKLAEKFKVAMAELAGTVLKIGKSKQLQLSERRREKDFLTNDQIINQLRSYFLRQVKTAPPPLFVGINENGEIALDKNDRGEEILLKVYRPAAGVAAFCLAKVTAASTTEIEVQVFARGTGKDKFVPKRYAVPPELLPPAAAEPGKVAETTESGGLNPVQQSKRIQAWMFKGGELVVKVLVRSILKSKIILVKRDGADYELNSDIFSEMNNQKVLVLLSEEKEGGKSFKAARIYRRNDVRSQECLAAFELPVGFGKYKGIEIDPW